MLSKKALLLIVSLFYSVNSFGASFKIPQADDSYYDPYGFNSRAEAYTLINFARINESGRFSEHTISMDLSSAKNYQLYDNVASIEGVQPGTLFILVNDQLIPRDGGDFDLSLVKGQELDLWVIDSKVLEPGDYKGLAPLEV